MSASLLIVLSLLVGFGAAWFAYRRTGKQHRASQVVKTKSKPSYYVWYVVLWCVIPALTVLLAWQIFEPHILGYFIHTQLTETLSESETALFVRMVPAAAAGLIPIDPRIALAVDVYNNLKATSNASLTVVFIALIIFGAIWGMQHIKTNFNARVRIESFIEKILILCSTIAILATIGIVLSVLFESIRFFQSVPVFDFLLGTVWSPQTAIRADQIGSSGLFGAIPLFTGTLLITIIVMLVSVPLGLMSALYLNEFAHPTTRTVIKPLLEVLAGIPTVVYGFFAALAVAPVIRQAGESIGLNVSSESALAAGITMGIMIIPFISSLSDDVIAAVPRSLREGSYSLGATRAETITKVILPAALPGIVGSILLAISRAIGETMIVVMAVGFAANLTANPLESVTTVTVQIVSLLKGDQEFDSTKTLAAFALGLTLFFITLMLNVLALQVVKKYREKYE